ncbi:MAG: hypothetical protein [Microvirus sp.]|nr:MAG: hypothetical protein [Microvirus sp.]
MHIFQLMRVENGERSPVIAEKAIAFAQHLRDQLMDNEQHVVLVLMDSIDNEWEFSMAPYMTAKRFTELHLGEKENG